MTFKVTHTPQVTSYSASIEDTDLLNWVKLRSEKQKFYFKLRDDSWEWAGSGNLFESSKMTFEDIYKLTQQNGAEDLKIFVAYSFDLDPKKAQPIFPRFEILNENGILTYKINTWKDEEDIQKFLNVQLPKQSAKDFTVSKKSNFNLKYVRQDNPTQEQWTPYFNRAQDFLERNSKVVLARVTEATFEKAVDPFALLDALKQQSYRCYVKLSDGREIISVSPERLFKVAGRELTTEAIAGTKPLGASHEEFLDSKKERAEHQYVVDEIQKQIEPFADQIELKLTPIVVAFKKVIHLKTPISAKLKDGVSIFNLIRALHPTPAVGGLPKNEALDWLESNEPFKREYYAAPIGVVSSNFTEFFVNIRSVLVEENKLKLYSGVGIVRESSAVSEWGELDLKASQFWEALS